MPHYIPRDGSSTVPAFDDTPSEAMPETVTGVPLQFSGQPTPNGQNSPQLAQNQQQQQQQLPATAVARRGNRRAGRRSLVDTSANQDPNAPQRLRASETQVATPVEDDGVTIGGVIRYSIAFPFRVVDYTVRLPFRAVGAAHKAASRAMRDDSTDPLRNYTVDRNQYTRERRARTTGQTEQYTCASKTL